MCEEQQEGQGSSSGVNRRIKKTRGKNEKRPSQEGSGGGWEGEDYLVPYSHTI